MSKQIFAEWIGFVVFVADNIESPERTAVFGGRLLISRCEIGGLSYTQAVHGASVEGFLRVFFGVSVRSVLYNCLSTVCR